MTFQKFILSVLLFVLLGLLGATPTKADPLLFSNVVALQNSGTNRVDLFANQGVMLTGPKMSFMVDIAGTLPPGVTQMLSVTYAEAGSPALTQTFQIPAFGTIPPPFTLLFTFDSPGATIAGTMATLRVDILGSAPDFVIPSGPQAGQRVDSYTYNFRAAQPVPEPGTMLMLATGIAGLWGARRRKGRGK
jgi:hypothetical protein